MREKQGKRDADAEGHDEITQQRQTNDDAGHDDRRGNDGPHRLAERQLVARHGVGGRYAEDKRREGAADGKEHRHRKAFAEAFHGEDLGDPFQRKTLRRKGERIASRKRGRDDDEERPDQETDDKKERERNEELPGHFLFLAVAMRFSRILAAKLMTIRMKAMTLAATKLLETVTCW
ncbi:hypothetical protein D3C86_1340410 [compost metagenome]